MTAGYRFDLVKELGISSEEEFVPQQEANNLPVVAHAAGLRGRDIRISRLAYDKVQNPTMIGIEAVEREGKTHLLPPPDNACRQKILNGFAENPLVPSVPKEVGN